jgi:hypothetical protein
MLDKLKSVQTKTKVTWEMAQRFRARGLLIPYPAEYEDDRLQSVAKTQWKLMEVMDELDDEIIRVAEDRL